MTATEYHSQQRVSSTWLRECDPPARLKYRMDNPIVPGEEMRLGTDIHRAFLEEDSGWVIEKAWQPDEMKLSSKEGIAWKKSLPPGTHIVKAKYGEAVTGCVESLLQHPVAKELAGCAANEQVFTWEEDGVPCKAMLDSEQTGFIADIKTGSGDGFASRERFPKTAYDRGLHIQAAWYMHAANIFAKPAEKFVFIAVETTPPYLVNVFECSPAFINAGIEEIDRRFPLIKHGLATGEWPGYATRMNTLDLPRYAKEVRQTSYITDL